ncbi:MAG: LamG-like jellyroll fold domain-containing protein [bacterium]
MSYSKQSQSSFTLIELLVVISIIGLLASIVLASLEGGEERAITGKAMNFSQTVRTTMGSDLVGEWRLDDGLDPTIDSSGNDNHGDLLPLGSEPNYVDGIFGKALNFDGVNDCVRIPATGESSYLDFGTDETVCVTAWIKTTQKKMQQWAYVFGFPGCNSGLVEWDDGRLIAEIREWDCASHLYTVLSSADYKENKWYFIVWQWDNGNFQVWVNAEKKVDQAVATHNNWYNRIHLAAVPHTQSCGSYKGVIDDVKVYERALSAQKIQDTYLADLEKYYEQSGIGTNF